MTGSARRRAADGWLAPAEIELRRQAETAWSVRDGLGARDGDAPGGCQSPTFACTADHDYATAAYRRRPVGFWSGRRRDTERHLHALRGGLAWSMVPEVESPRGTPCSDPM